MANRLLYAADIIKQLFYQKAYRMMISWLKICLRNGEWYGKEKRMDILQ